MSTLFDTRLRSFEASFSHNQEISFKIASRATRHMAVWVSSFLGLNEEMEKDYIDECINIEVSEFGFEGLINKFYRDLFEMGLEFDRAELCRIFDSNVALAKQEFMTAK